MAAVAAWGCLAGVAHSDPERYQDVQVLDLGKVPPVAEQDGLDYRARDVPEPGRGWVVGLA